MPCHSVVPLDGISKSIFRARNIYTAWFKDSFGTKREQIVNNFPKHSLLLVNSCHHAE